MVMSGLLEVVMEYRETLIFFFVLMALLSLPLELMLISVMKKTGLASKKKSKRQCTAREFKGNTRPCWK